MATRTCGALLVAALAIGSCAPPEPAPVAVPRTRDPDIRIGVLLNARRASIAASGAFQIEDPVEGTIRVVGAGGAIDVEARGRSVSAGDGEGRVERANLTIEPVDTAGTVRLNGRDYHGVLEVLRSDSGVTVVNRVSLEAYLVGVVGAEMGRRAPGEAEALKAQAIASRTYAIRNQGRWNDRGYDLVGTVNDQVYSGTYNDNAMAAAAVAATRGQIITYNSQPIDAFFSSTCGGRTENGTAAFAGADRPYLRSVDDLDPSGTPWCAASPRFRWSAEWSGASLAATLRRTLPAENISAARASDLTDIRIGSHTASGRIATLELSGSAGRTILSGQAIRRALSPPEGGPLRSTDFTIRISRSGGRIERVAIDGRGNGHAVGMCQWGAIGRARAGQDYRTILTSYFPGTEIQRLY